MSTHPRYIRMIRELVVERMAGSADRPALGSFGASHDVCPENCCLYPRPTGGPGSRPGTRPAATPNG